MDRFNESGARFDRDEEKVAPWSRSLVGCDRVAPEFE